MILDHKSSFKNCFMQHNLHQDQTINTCIWYTQELLTWETFAIGPGKAYMTLIMTFDLENDLGSWAQFQQLIHAT